MTGEVVDIGLRMPPRYDHEFDCIGCGRNVIAFVHFGNARLCLMCQAVGPEMSKAMQDRGESIFPLETPPHA